MAGWWEDLTSAVGKWVGGLPASMGLIVDSVTSPLALGPLGARFYSDESWEDEWKRKQKLLEANWGKLSEAFSATFDIPFRLLNISPETQQNVFQALEWPLENLVFEPLSTLGTVGAGAVDVFQRRGFGEAAGSLLDGDRWASAYQMAQPRGEGPGAREWTPAQSLANVQTNLIRIYLGQETLDPFTDQQEIERFLNIPAVKVVTGIQDGFLGFVADPTIVGGKVAAGAKVAKYVRPLDKVIKGKEFKKKAFELYDEQPLPRSTSIDVLLQTSSWNGFYEWTRGKSALEIARHPSLKTNPDAMRLATLSSQAKNAEQFNLAWRVALGDDNALNLLNGTNKALAVDAAHLHNYENYWLNSVVTNTEAGRPYVPGPEFKKWVNDKIEANEEARKWVESLQELTPFSQVHSVPGGKAQQKVADLSNRLFTANTRNKSIRQSIYQMDLFTPVVRFIQSAAPGSAVPGVVDMSRGDSWKPFGALLNRVNIDTETKQKLLDNYMAADSEMARVDAASRIQDAAIASLAERHLGLRKGEKTPEGKTVTQDVINATVQRIVRANSNHREGYLGRSRRYGSTEYKGSYVDQFETTDGSAIALPLTERQLDRTFPMVDIDRWDELLKRDGRRIRKLLGEGVDVVAHIGDLASAIWKAGTLLLRPVAYPLRTLQDDQLRIVTSLGAMSSMSANVASRAKNAWSNAKIRHEYMSAVGDIQRTRRAGGAVLGDLAPMQTYRLGEAPETILGQQVEGSMGGEFGEIYRDLISSRGTLREQVEGSQGAWLKQQRESRSWRTLNPTIENESQHLADWHYAIMNHLKGSQIATRLLQGQTPEMVVAWLKSPSAQARRLRKQVPTWAADPTDWVGRIDAIIEDYIPAHSKLRQKVLDGTLTEQDLAKAIPDVTKRPAVHAAMVEYNTNGGPFGKFYNETMEKLWYAIGDLPTDTLSRQPLFNELYKKRMETLIRSTENAKVYNHLGQLNPRILKQFERNAREFALKEVRSLLYDISKRSSIAHVMRFVAPFYNAWSDSMVTWLNLLGDKPQLLAQAGMIWNAPNQVAAAWEPGYIPAEDENGNPLIDPQTGEPVMVEDPERFFVRIVDNDGNVIKGRTSIFDTNERIQVQIPHSWAKKLGPVFDRMFGGQTTVYKSSMNTSLQGNPFYIPGAGPIVQIPANWVAKQWPGTEEAFKRWGVLPFGARPNSMDLIQPAMVRDISTAWDGASATIFNDPINQATNPEFSNLYMSIMQDEIARFRSGDRESEPTPEEIRDKATLSAVLKVLTRATVPYSTTRESDYQFYIDQYQKLQRTDPVNADRVFHSRYGQDFYVFALAKTKNNTGIQATISAVKKSDEYRDIIAKYPELGSLIVGPDGKGDFSNAAYLHQLERAIKPGSSETDRQRQSPEEALKTNNVRLGWNDYVKKIGALDQILKARGLTSYTKKGAEDLRFHKQLMTEYLGQSNPDWYEDFTVVDLAKWPKRIAAMEELVKIDRLRNAPLRSDIRTLDRYLKARKWMQSRLAARARGGAATSSIDSEKNEDLKFTWDLIVDGLKTDTRFEDLYNRYLERDDLSG